MSMRSFARRLRNEERGASLILITLSLMVLMGFAGAWVCHAEIFRALHHMLEYVQLLGSGTLSPDSVLPEEGKGDIGLLAQSLNRFLQRSRDTDRTKDRFLAAMSHEIRTPMNGVIGFLGNLRETPLNEQQQQYVRVIESSARSLLKVINGILDFSKLSAGRMDLEQVAFDLGKLLEDCIAVTRQLVKGKPEM